MLRVARDQGTVMAFYNYGGARTGFLIPEGQTIREITVADNCTITPDDGTEADMHDTQTLYRVCSSGCGAAVPRSAFEGKTPIVPESDAQTGQRGLYLSAAGGIRGQ